MKLRRRGESIGDIIREECGKRKASEEELRKGSGRSRGNEVQAAITHRRKEEPRISEAETARYLGVNTSSFNRALAKMGPSPTKYVMHR
jgi:hypothetical protein